MRRSKTEDKYGLHRDILGISPDGKKFKYTDKHKFFFPFKKPKKHNTALEIINEIDKTTQGFSTAEYEIYNKIPDYMRFKEK